MTEAHDPIRALWEALETPPAHRTLAEEDAETRAAVAWLQRAMAQVRPTTIPSLPVRTTHRRTWLRRLVPFAAAAALLVLARVAMHEPPAVPLPDVVHAPPMPTLPTPPEVPAAPVTAASVEMLVSDAQQLEMRSGPVRLTLIHPQTRTNS